MFIDDNTGANATPSGFVYYEDDAEPHPEVGAHLVGGGHTTVFKTGAADKNVIRAVLVQPYKTINFNWFVNRSHSETFKPLE